MWFIVIGLLGLCVLLVSRLCDAEREIRRLDQRVSDLERFLD